MKNWKKSPYMKGREILPLHWKKGSTIVDIMKNFEASCFGARNVAVAAHLLEEMINENDTIWLGVAGAGIAGGLGGYVIDLIEHGFIDVICSTGAQVYHDAHFAFGLPVVQGCPRCDDDALDRDGTTRIYDIYIRMKETLIVQDEKFKKFAQSKFAKRLRGKKFSTADYSNAWGLYMLNNAPYPERSFVATATKYNVPVFWDSESNHSIGMMNADLNIDGINITPDPSRSLDEGAAIEYKSKSTGFFELGGGGPKNWIQTLAPMISQIARIKWEGADRGIQITTAPEYDGGLSGCTFSEGVTWGKYKETKQGLVQVQMEYSVPFPLIVGYVLEACKPRGQKQLYDYKKIFYQKLIEARKKRKMAHKAVFK